LGKVVWGLVFLIEFYEFRPLNELIFGKPFLEVSIENVFFTGLGWARWCLGNSLCVVQFLVLRPVKLMKVIQGA
jgi:hypothetical protein